LNFILEQAAKLTKGDDANNANNYYAFLQTEDGNLM